jgi:hypothetical protein
VAVYLTAEAKRKEDKMKILRISSVVFLLAATTVGLIKFVEGRNKNKVYSPRSYRMVRVLTLNRYGGTSSLNSVSVRWVNSRGEWKEITYYPEHGKVNTWWNIKDGSFSLGNQQMYLQYDGEPTPQFFPQMYSDEELLKLGPIREETVLGFKTYVFKDTGSNYQMETYNSPEVGLVPLKQIIRSSTGEEINEVVKIDFVDVPDEILQLPKLPIRTDLLRADIERAEKEGDKKGAERLREVLRKWEEKHQQEQNK